MTDQSLTDRPLTPAEVAERYSIPISTLHYWRRTNQGPRAMKVGRHLRYHPDDLEAWERVGREAS